MAKLIRALRERFGDEVYQIVAKQNGEKAFAEWKSIAEKKVSISIDELIKYLWEPLKNEGFEYEVEKTELGVQMKCTRCGFYDLAKHFGFTEEAFYMICESDSYITAGFNPNIVFKRTKTLMQGHDCCDHFYCLED
jgi:predicted ArsR family transcriptional regulator